MGHTCINAKDFNFAQSQYHVTPNQSDIDISTDPWGKRVFPHSPVSKRLTADHPRIAISVIGKACTWDKENMFKTHNRQFAMLQLFQWAGNEWNSYPESRNNLHNSPF